MHDIYSSYMALGAVACLLLLSQCLLLSVALGVFRPAGSWLRVVVTLVGWGLGRLSCRMMGMRMGGVCLACGVLAGSWFVCSGGFAGRSSKTN